jgi:hypothetical protein
MATELKGTKSLNGEIFMTSFYGGKANGRCVQLTPEYGVTVCGERYIQLTEDQARELARALNEFVIGVREEAE